jgi:hypothetical protein
VHGIASLSFGDPDNLFAIEICLSGPEVYRVTRCMGMFRESVGLSIHGCCPDSVGRSSASNSSLLGQLQRTRDGNRRTHTAQSRHDLLSELNGLASLRSSRGLDVSLEVRFAQRVMAERASSQVGQGSSRISTAIEENTAWKGFVCYVVNVWLSATSVCTEAPSESLSLNTRTTRCARLSSGGGVLAWSRVT